MDEKAPLYKAGEPVRFQIMPWAKRDGDAKWYSGEIFDSVWDERGFFYYMVVHVIGMEPTTNGIVLEHETERGIERDSKATPVQ